MRKEGGNEDNKPKRRVSRRLGLSPPNLALQYILALPYFVVKASKIRC